MAPKLILLDLSLRLTVVPLSAVTIWLTVTNQQDNSTYVNLKFSNFSGLKYMICTSAASAGFALAAALCTWVKCLACKSWLFFVPDQIITYLMVTSGAAVLEILNLAQNGDKEVTWSEACSSYGKFCNRMKLALTFHALSLCCFVVLAAISAYRAFNVFQPPYVHPKGEQVERAQGSIDFQS